MDRETITVLYVEPDATTRMDVTERIEEYDDMAVIGVEDIEGALTAVDEHHVDCVVSEHDLSDGTGLELFAQLRDEQPNIACILYTETGFMEIDTGEFEDVVVEYLSKRIPGTERRLPELARLLVADRMQVGYPVPEDENERLAAVRKYDVSELSSREAFDRLTALARAQFDVDTAFVGIMKADKEEIIACQGSQLSMLLRENSICTYSMLEPEVNGIEDVHEDPRFEHNERLRELDIRSYAGSDLITSDGRVIGEFCLLDDSPRSYDVEERNLLRMYADEVMEQMELRRRLTDTDETMNVGE
jgi:CheY-like chemotaxis protein